MVLPSKFGVRIIQMCVLYSNFYGNRYFPYWKILFFKFHFFKKLLLRNYVVDFVEISNVCARKAIIEAAKRIINSDKMCRSYNDLNFGVTFLEHSVV